jgi:hypothetical protein
MRHATDLPGRGHVFMLMGDKYTWIRGSRRLHPPEEPGNWYSFPGMIPNPGECITLEAAWGPRLHELRVNGVVLYTLAAHRRRRLGDHRGLVARLCAFESVQYLPGHA